MEKRLHDLDHCVQLVRLWSPSSVSGGAAGVHEHLQNLFFVATYLAGGLQTLQLLVESYSRIDLKQF